MSAMIGSNIIINSRGDRPGTHPKMTKPELKKPTAGGCRVTEWVCYGYPDNEKNQVNMFLCM